MNQYGIILLAQEAIQNRYEKLVSMLTVTPDSSELRKKKEHLVHTYTELERMRAECLKKDIHESLQKNQDEITTARRQNARDFVKTMQQEESQQQAQQNQTTSGRISSENPPKWTICSQYANGTRTVIESDDEASAKRSYQMIRLIDKCRDHSALVRMTLNYGDRVMASYERDENAERS